MSTLANIRSIFKSLFYKRSKLKPGSTFYGVAKSFVDTTFEPGSDMWKESYYSFKLIVDRIEDDRVYYYSSYIDEEANENVRNKMKFINVDSLVKQVRSLTLIAE